MTSWAFNVLGDHRNELTRYKLSKVEDVRLDRWTSVHYVKQVVGCAGTEGALTILHIVARSVGLCPTAMSLVFLMKRREPRNLTKPAPGAVGRIAVLMVSVKLAPA